MTLPAPSPLWKCCPGRQCVCRAACCQQQCKLLTALLDSSQQLEHRPVLCGGFMDHPAPTQVSARPSVSVLFSLAWNKCICIHLDTHWSFSEMCTKWTCAKPGDVEGELNVAAEVWHYVHLYRFDIRLWFAKLSRVPVRHSARTAWFSSLVEFREEYLSVKTVVKARFYRSLLLKVNGLWFSSSL